MQLDFTNLFNSSSEVINVDYVFCDDGFLYGTYNPLKNGAAVKGKAYQKVGIVYLDLEVNFDFYGL